MREDCFGPQKPFEAYQSAKRSVNATGAYPRFAQGSAIRLLSAWILLVVLTLPAFASPGSPPESDTGLFSIVPVPLAGSSLVASLYRPAMSGSEGVVLLSGSGAAYWSQIIDSLLDRGVTVLSVPGSLPVSVALSAFRAFESDLGDGAVVGLGASGSEAGSAWELARQAQPGAVLFIEARSELAMPPYLLDPEGQEAVLLLAREEDFLARERARSVFLAAPGRVELWLVDGGGMEWPDVFARRDIASDLAHWWLRSLEVARAARTVPVAERSEAAQ